MLTHDKKPYETPEMKVCAMLTESVLLSGFSADVQDFNKYDDFEM